MGQKAKTRTPIFGGLDTLSVYRQWQRMRDKLFSVAIGPSFGSFGAHTVIQPPVHVYGWDRISIGPDVFVGADSSIVALDAGPGMGATIDIGAGTHIAGLCVISAARAVRLGQSVLIGRNVHISDHAHAYADPSRPVLAQGIEHVMAVEIGDGAWLGNNTVVTPGVHIGEGAVIGANSVVKVDIPAFCVAVGAPARVVRTFA